VLDSNAIVLPVPVGDSSSAFSLPFNAAITFVVVVVVVVVMVVVVVVMMIMMMLLVVVAVPLP
jgi:hypothetical protein